MVAIDAGDQLAFLDRIAFIDVRSISFPGTLKEMSTWVSSILPERWMRLASLCLNQSGPQKTARGHYGRDQE